MKCKICSSSTKQAFNTKLMNKYLVNYYCDKCGFLQTEEPYWLEEAYSTPITLTIKKYNFYYRITN